MSGVMLSGPSFRPKSIQLDGGIITHSPVHDAFGRHAILDWQHFQRDDASA